jgi:hypothetical protein
MRGIGWLRAFGSLGLSTGSHDEVQYDRIGFAHRGRQGYGTGWRTRQFQHPEGPCSFRPTGTKRTRRRQFGRAYGRWTQGGAQRFVEAHMVAFAAEVAEVFIEQALRVNVRPFEDGLLNKRTIR